MTQLTRFSDKIQYIATEILLIVQNIITFAIKSNIYITQQTKLLYY